MNLLAGNSVKFRPLEGDKSHLIRVLMLLRSQTNLSNRAEHSFLLAAPGRSAVTVTNDAGWAQRMMGMQNVQSFFCHTSHTTETRLTGHLAAPLLPSGGTATVSTVSLLFNKTPAITLRQPAHHPTLLSQAAHFSGRLCSVISSPSQSFASAQNAPQTSRCRSDSPGFIFHPRPGRGGESDPSALHQDVL